MRRQHPAAVLAASTAIAVAAMIAPAAATPATATSHPLAIGAAPTQPCTHMANLVRAIRDVRVRAAPSTTAPALGVLPAGAWVAMAGKTSAASAWIKVRWYGGRTGWLAKKDPRTGRRLVEGPWIRPTACGKPTSNVAKTPASTLEDIRQQDLSH